MVRRTSEIPEFVLDDLPTLDNSRDELSIVHKTHNLGEDPYSMTRNREKSLSSGNSDRNERGGERISDQRNASVSSVGGAGPSNHKHHPNHYLSPNSSSASKKNPITPPSRLNGSKNREGTSGYASTRGKQHSPNSQTQQQLQARPAHKPAIPSPPIVVSGTSSPLPYSSSSATTVMPDHEDYYSGSEVSFHTAYNGASDRSDSFNSPSLTGYSHWSPSLSEGPPPQIGSNSPHAPNNSWYELNAGGINKNAEHTDHYEYDYDHDHYQRALSSNAPVATISDVKRGGQNYSSPVLNTRYNWNTVEPSEWTNQRVLQWLEDNNFSQQWIDLFYRQGVSGQNFFNLGSYQNLKKLGHLPMHNSEDTPSRFIRLLRKLQNKSLSGVSDDVPSPRALRASQLSPSTDVSPVVSNHRQFPSRPSLGSDTEVDSSSVSTQENKRKSMDDLTFRGNTSPTTTTKTFTFSNSHQKSHSSGTEYNTLDGSTLDEQKVKGLFSRLKNQKKMNRRSKSQDLLDFDPESLKHVDALDMVDIKFKPTKKLAEWPVENKRVLVTLNGEIFTRLDIGNPQSISELQAKLGDIFLVQQWQDLTIYLTEFGFERAETPLDGQALATVLKSRSTIKLHVDIPPVQVNSSVSPAHSWSASDGAQRYPATPQYLIDSHDNKEGDYFSLQKEVLKKHVNVSPNYPSSITSSPPALTTIPTFAPPRKLSITKVKAPTAISSPLSSPDTNIPGNINSISKTTPIEINYENSSSQTSSAHEPEIDKHDHKSTPKPSISSSDNDSFKIIRPQKKREINFDDRRASPYDRSTPIVPRRNAPPPPEDPHARRAAVVSVHAFSPGSSETLIPQPYHGGTKRQQVARKPVGSESPSPQAESVGGKPHDIPRAFNPAYAVERKGSLLRRSTTKRIARPKESEFVENEISFAGAPEFEDDDSDSDNDGSLWAKKPPVPSLSPAQPSSVQVFTSALSSNVDESKSPHTPSLESNWTVRPSAEVVYDNLEKFFPDADLDKPIINETISPPTSPVAHTLQANHQQKPSLSPVAELGSRTFRNISQKVPTLSHLPNKTELTDASSSPFTANSDRSVRKYEVPLNDTNDNKPRRRSRMKTIRVVAKEASEARKRFSEAAQKSTNGKNEVLLRRKSTKLWGRKLVEVTPNEMSKSNAGLVSNTKGPDNEFVWVKGELIGKGTFGKVYLALNVTTGEMMAVKQVEVPQTASDKLSVKFKEVADAIHLETENLKDLDHPNIVQYLGFESNSDFYSLFLEYVPGGSVGRVLRMHGRFSEDIIRHLSKQICDGLSYLHSCQIVHRDLKADNLLLETDGVIKISDFGISKKSSDIYANNAEMSMQGTIFWMAPEVVQNVVDNNKVGYSAKVDVWSFGCVVLEMYAGRRPWSTDEAIGAMYKLGTSRQAPPIPEDTKEYVSDMGRHFLDLCFTINPDERPTADQLLNDEFCKISNFNFSQTKLAEDMKLFNQQRSMIGRKNVQQVD